jgi:amino acid transporter
MAEQKPTRAELIAQDEAELRRLGYAQQLFREMGGFSNFAISFSIISILTGAVLLYGYGLKFAGPIINSVGWPVVSLFTLCVAASMAELASAYPTAGGLYFWAFRLGGRGWAWMTAWLNMIGQVTIVAGVNVAAATYIIGAVTRIFNIPEDAKIPLFGSLSAWYFQLTVMVLIMIPQLLLNTYGIRITAMLNHASVYWHIAGVLLIAAFLAFFGKYHNPISFLFTSATPLSPLEASSAEIAKQTVPAVVFGELRFHSPIFSIFPGLVKFYGNAPFIFVFILGLLQAQWTYTGYDASAHTAEETVMARKNSAWGVFLSVAVSAVVGYILLLILTWCIPRGDVAKTANDQYPVLYIAYENLGKFSADLVAILIGGAMWLCGCSSITSMARMWYAFARDDGMPGSRYLKRVSGKYRTPVVAIWVVSGLAILLCLYAAAYSVITSISTITLYLAYIIPVYLNWRNKRARKGEYITPELAPWNMGKWGNAINTIAILWTVFIVIVFSIPPNESVFWTMLLLGLLMAIYWKAYAAKHFTGPKAQDEVALETLAEAQS